MKPWLTYVVFGVACVACIAFGYVAGTRHMLTALTHPSALDACHKLARDGVAQNCRVDSPGGLQLAAREVVLFDLRGSGTGAVLTFDDVERYDRTVKVYDDMAAMVGPHRYGNRQRLVFVQMNMHAPRSDADAVANVLEGL